MNTVHHPTKKRKAAILATVFILEAEINSFKIN